MSEADEDRLVDDCISVIGRHAHIVIADNVFSYLTNTGRESFTGLDFPSCRPPFDYMWIEWQADTSFIFGTSGHEERLSQYGTLVVSCKCGESQFDELKRVLPVGDGVEVFCMFFSFACLDGNPTFMATKSVLAVNADGTPAGSHTFTKGPFADEASAEMCFPPALMAISFMNCKNVVKQDATETEGPANKWLRRMKQPKLRYHVLNIEPMKQVLRTEGGVEQNGLKKALHICRGHFATYTDDKPLFGRVTGTFWKPSHVRGSIEQGAVVKDYAVKV